MDRTALDIDLDNSAHRIISVCKPDSNIKPWHPVSRAEAHRWCLLNGQANIDKLIPAKPTDIKPRQPWYKREPKPEWVWLIRPLQLIRRRWVEMTLHIMVWGAVFVVLYAMTAMWLGG